MKNKNGIILIGIVAFFAMVAMTATASALPAENVVWLEPEDSSVPGYCNTKEVEVWANITDPDGCTNGTLTITYDPGCANVTDWELNTVDWPLGTWDSNVDGREWIAFGAVFKRTGNVLIGTLAIHCNSTSFCTTPLIFDEGSSLFAPEPTRPLDVEWKNGTFTCEVLKPDLNVTKVEVNYDASSLGGRAVGPEPGPGVHTECNNISAVIEEDNGVDVVSPFDVTFEVDGTTLCTMRVPGLTGGATKTVYCNCSWRPMAGDNFAINVTVDSNDEIPESDETNNTMWNTGTVVSNGYKGDGWQGPDMNLTNVQCHDQDTINLIYSVGDSYYAGGNWSGATEYVVNWTTNDLPVPEDAVIEKAWLYVYYTWDKEGIMPNGVNLKFNDNNNIPLDRSYSDRKGFGSYNYPYGMIVYEVTSEFVATANNKAVLSKPAPDTYIPIRGMLLMVVYKHPDEPERIICINEGYDMINAQASYGVTPEEATTYAAFGCCEPIPQDEIGKATLVAVAPGASMGDDKNRLSFNDGLWKGAWSGFAGSTELGIAETDVLNYLKEENNVANFQDRGDWMEASNAFLILEKGVVEKPDLNVTEIELKCGGYLFGNESNEICAKIENIGSGDAGAFNVSFVIDGFSEEVRINGLAAGENTTVCVNDATSRNAGDSVTITVTADCNGEVTESDETNNESTMTTTVVNNGYKGKRYTGGEDITTWKTFELHGNLVYSVGDSYYLSSSSYPDWTTYTVNWTASDLPVPDTATIKEARLYVPYTWDKGGVMPDEVSLTFNGIDQTLAAHYSDEKGWATSYPYGMLAYNVTGDFDTSGNTAVLLNSHPGGDKVSIRGMLLVVVYADECELPQRKIFVNEGFDLLYGGASKCTTPEEATAYAPFGTMNIDISKVDSAKLITVAPGAGPNEGELLFNGQIWNDVWNFTTATQIGIDERDVTSYLRPTDNEAGFQSSGDWMEASNAFLIVTEKITETEYQKKIPQPIDVNKIHYKFIAVNEEWAAKWTNEIQYVQKGTKYSIAVYLNKAGYVTRVDFERWGFPIAEIPVELAAQSLAKLNP